MYTAAMDLNYHHLYYFWVVAREGSIARACEQLHVSQPTVSAQIKDLERAVGEPLFTRTGRRLVLTETGRTVLDYAGEIFALGRELVSAVRQRPTGRPLRLAVGVTDAMPKLVARALLEPALRLPGQPVHLVCREDSTERLLLDLSAHRLDVVLSDVPAGTAGAAVRTFDHLLGESGITFFGGPALAKSLRRGFPKSLDAAPAFMPGEGTALRRALDQWLGSRGIAPRLVGEFADSALLKTFGQTGLAVFPAPTVVEEEVCRQYRVKPVGRIDAVRERFYAITAERKVRHPAVAAISDAARRDTFG